ncbi:hypothetical protein ACFFHK_01115 [Gallibacterium trehalosifermentans]|uniref:Uncharacterized protein n=1 Tax=Gallibacterium trehalosifermentans TaxID=516935 RepID=A0ABV6GY57_9PAST
MKKTVISAALLATAVAGHSTAATPLRDITESITSVRQLLDYNADIEQIFIAVDRLTQSLGTVNAKLKASGYRINDERFELLLLARELIKVSSKSVVDKYEEEIYTIYNKRYRAFSSAVFQFDTTIYKIREKKGLIKTVNVEGLSLTEEDLLEVSKAAIENTKRYENHHA